MHTKVVIHLTDGVDAQYNVMKERVEKMREEGKNNHFVYDRNGLTKALFMMCYLIPIYN